MRKMTSSLLWIFFLIATCGCIRPWPAPTVAVTVPTVAPIVLPTENKPPPILPTSTPEPTLVPTPAPTQTLVPLLQVWIDPDLASRFPKELQFKPQELVASVNAANLRIEIGGNGKPLAPIGHWIYALVAPFPTLIDNVKLSDVKTTWQGSPGSTMDAIHLLVDESTRQVLERAWGSPSARVKTVKTSDLLDTAWQEKTSWAILPFDALQPRWKVLRIDGQSPLDRKMDDTYGLSFPVTVDGDSIALEKFNQKFGKGTLAFLSNRDPEKLTVLVMTGVSALVRGSAWFMEQKGLLYPGRDIRNWLREADLTHVSNEISFNPKCAPPNGNDPSLRFCSDPKYIQLFEDVGVDIVEMTGNHLNDFGREWVNYTIEMYQARSWLYYGAGLNDEQARKPAFITDHGNRLAFIGCNPAGPPADWATSDAAGTNNCGSPGLDTLEAEIRRLAGEGYQVIVTLQYFESYDPTPQPDQYSFFRRLSDAGAVIVSGSQAHLPQAMELRNQGIIHYGLGNLFFDQMDTPWPDTKYEFIDRHVFYQGRYLGVEFLTATLEDFVKPRPMTPQERLTELTKIFAVSGWSQSNGKPWR